MLHAAASSRFLAVTQASQFVSRRLAKSIGCTGRYAIAAYSPLSRTPSFSNSHQRYLKTWNSLQLFDKLPLTPCWKIFAVEQLPLLAAVDILNVFTLK